MAFPEVLRAANVEKDESRLTGGQGVVNVPAVGLEPEEPLEMRRCIAARRRRNRSDVVGHDFSPGRLRAACRPPRRVTIGKNAIYHRNHAKGARSSKSTGGGPAAREGGDVRAGNRYRDIRAAETGDGTGLVPVGHGRGGTKTAWGHGRIAGVSR